MQTNKQTPLLACHFTQHMTYLVCGFSLMDTMTLPDCQVRWSHSIQTFKSTCTFWWSLCSWINNVDDFFPKIFKNIQCYSDLSHASSGAGKQGKCSESCFLVFLQEQEHRKKGPKERGNKEKRNSFKENATKLLCRMLRLNLAVPAKFRLSANEFLMPQLAKWANRSWNASSLDSPQRERYSINWWVELGLGCICWYMSSKGKGSDK